MHAVHAVWGSFDKFSSVAADIATETLPNSERSGKKVCKNETLFDFITEMHHGNAEKENGQKRATADEPQISRADLRVDVATAVFTAGPFLEHKNIRINLKS